MWRGHSCPRARSAQPTLSPGEGAGPEGSAAEDINAANDICFVYFDTAGKYHAALLHGGKYYKFNPFNSAESGGYGLNDKMTVAGIWSAKTNGILHGYKGVYH